MKNSDIKIFESYLSGALEGTPLLEFEEKLNQSKSFRLSFNAYKSGFQALSEEPKWQSINSNIDNLRDEIISEKESYFKAYKAGELSAEEKEIFEQDLKEDELLNYEFKRFENPNPKKPELKVLKTNQARVVSFRTPSIKTLISIAAMFVVAFGAFWVYNNSNQLNTDKLYASNFDMPSTTPVKSDMVIMGEEAPIANSKLLQIKDQGLKAYEEGDYHLAIEKLEDFVKNSTQNDDSYYIYLYVGVSYMQLDLYDQAIQILTLSRDNIKDEINNSRRKDRVNWYLSLAHLKNGNEAQFSKITESLLGASNSKIKVKAEKIMCEYDSKYCNQQ